jgi:PAS domain S-box-containing protein
MGFVRSYGLAIGGVALAVLVRWLLDPVLADTLPLVTLFGAVVLAVWAGGALPAILVAVIGFLVCNYLFMEPRGELGLGTPQNLVGFLAFLITSALIIAIGHAMRRAQGRANERREVLRVTLSSIGDAVITTDTDGAVTYLNSVAEQLTGWSSAEAQGRPLAEVFRIVNQTTDAAAENPALRALREGKVVGLANHTVLIARNGNRCPIDDSAAPITDELGHVAGCVLIFRDVTVQRETEAVRLRELATARLLAAIVESSDDAIVSKSLEGTIQSWNAAAERLFGYRAEEAIGKHISLVIPPDRLAEEDTIIATLTAGRRIEHFETERVHKQGRRVHVSLTISPIHDDSGRVVGASKIVRDITARKLAEAEREKLTADLRVADQRKNEFIATLAHELRNPLAPISNMLEVLKHEDTDPAARRQAREVMERQLRQLVRLVDDLLDLNRITHNRLELRQDEVELAPVIQQAIEASRPLAAASDQRISVSLPAGPVWLRADPARLAQVFGNLFNNASRYSPAGATITVSARAEADDVVVSVRDNGIGIPPDKLEEIFDMFMQLDRTHAQAQGGLGIGLTLAKRLVQMHGGTIEARSEGAGLGSEFLVRLPVVKAPAASAQPARGPLDAAARRVLVVDDNADAAMSLAMLLQIAGNETHVVHDGLAALDAAREFRPNVMLLDIGMPKLDGYEVCRRLRSQPWGAEIFVIALTGWGQEDDRRKSAAAGFDGHLVKPIEPEMLSNLLATLPARREGHNGRHAQAIGMS